MKDWKSLVPEDFDCSWCDTPAGEACKDSSGRKARDPHGSRRDKCRHEKYVQGLIDRTK